MPVGAVSALMNISWMTKYYHDESPIRLQSRFVSEDARLTVGKTPVTLDTRTRKPQDDFARFEITAAEEVPVFKGYAVNFQYPSEGVLGKALLVPASHEWRAIHVGGGER